MTRKCSRCGADNLPEAKFCEGCGNSLDETTVKSGEPTQSLSPRPGSLRDAIPFLTGGVDQAKARFDGWKQKKTRSDTEKLREEHFEAEREKVQKTQQPPKKEGFTGMVARILVGVLALALLIYMLVRNPKLPSWMVFQMVDEMTREWGLGS